MKYCSPSVLIECVTLDKAAGDPFFPARRELKTAYQNDLKPSHILILLLIEDLRPERRLNTVCISRSVGLDNGETKNLIAAVSYGVLSSRSQSADAFLSAFSERESSEECSSMTRIHGISQK